MSDLMQVMGSSKVSDWRTPQWLFDEVLKEFPITLDACASAENTMCRYYIDKELDALSQHWLWPHRVKDRDNGHAVVDPPQSVRFRYAWMNPPYGRFIGGFIKKASEQALCGVTVIVLVPARTDTRWWWDYVQHQEVRFLRGRLKFNDGGNSAPFPSAIVIFRGSHSLPRTTYWG